MMEHECFEPELLECHDLGSYAEYEDNLFNLFIETYVENPLSFQELTIKLKRYPPGYDVRSCFYHIICENYFGGNEDDRKPNLRRCERILHPEHIIEMSDADKCTEVIYWENTRKGKDNIVFYCTNIRYLVVLGKRNNYLLLVTAYPITEDHRHKKLLSEYEDYISQKANNAPA